jgi:murein DD-endopeptidase MepM/ murein hydrolase activator NlpD
MVSFLKRLYQLRGQKVTFVIWDEQNPDTPESYQLTPRSIFYLNVFVILLLVTGVNMVLMFTPAGSYLSAPHESTFRNELLGITTRIIELQDSLTQRDMQLMQMRDVLRQSPDTTFDVNVNFSNSIDLSDSRQSMFPAMPMSDFNYINLLSGTNEIVSSQDPVFPAFFPATGTISRNFYPDTGHFGIDVAAQIGSEVRSVAWGIVSSVEWSLNYGYIIHLQHKIGYLSIYKHLASPTVKKGDIVSRGDILGFVSNAGLLSSGPHLHFELWQNSQALNPIHYLINP